VATVPSGGEGEINVRLWRVSFTFGEILRIIRRWSDFHLCFSAQRVYRHSHGDTKKITGKDLVVGASYLHRNGLFVRHIDAIEAARSVTTTSTARAVAASRCS